MSVLTQKRANEHAIRPNSKVCKNIAAMARLLATNIQVGLKEQTASTSCFPMCNTPK